MYLSQICLCIQSGMHWYSLSMSTPGQILALSVKVNAWFTSVNCLFGNPQTATQTQVPVLQIFLFVLPESSKEQSEQRAV